MTDDAIPHDRTDGGGHSPSPWKIVRSPIPYYTWIMSADGGVVCNAFGFRDERLLVAAPILLAACELALAQCDPALPVYADLEAAIALAKGP